ncbi:MAG: hypothetical protein ACLUGQ_06100 [Coprococcus sp.]
MRQRKCRKQEHVLAADGSYYEDMIYEDADGKEKVLRAQSITEHVNTLELRDGRMPEADDECVWWMATKVWRDRISSDRKLRLRTAIRSDTKDGICNTRNTKLSQRPAGEFT